MEVYDLYELQRKLHEWNLLSNRTMVFAEEDFALFDDIRQISLGDGSLRVNMAVFGICLEGSCEVTVGTKAFCFRKNNYIVVLPNQVVTWKDGSDDMKAIFICCNSRFFGEILQHQRSLLPLLLYVREHPCAELGEKDIAWIADYHRLLFNEMTDADNRFRETTAKALMQALVSKVCNLYTHGVSEGKPLNNRQEEIFAAFLQELGLYYRRHHDLSFYAERLCITPKYLSAVVKEVSGISALKWIEYCVIEEARMLLQTSSLNVQQIANLLNFPSQSFFGKYVKKHTGYSPQALRKMAGQTPQAVALR